jgi:hypothetical protein
MMYEQLTARVLVTSLQSRLCPACGKTKNRAMTFCGGDYRKLPAAMKRALYNRVGHGYEEAVKEALAFLEVTAPHLPVSSEAKETR